jgi:hypothetical protein
VFQTALERLRRAWRAFGVSQAVSRDEPTIRVLESPEDGQINYDLGSSLYKPQGRHCDGVP